MKNYLVPTVIKKTSDGERAYDLDSRMLEDRIIIARGEVEDGMASIITEELLYLNDADPEAPIHLYLMGPGGSVHAGLAVINTMKTIKAPVYTYCMGYCASMDAAIFSAGDKRFLLPDSQIMVHQVASGAEGKVHDLVVNLNYDKRLNNLLLAMIARNCKRLTQKEYEIIKNAIDEMVDDDENAVLKLDAKLAKKLSDFKKEVDRDVWLMPKSAIKFGIADEIVKEQK